MKNKYLKNTLAGIMSLVMTAGAAQLTEPVKTSAAGTVVFNEVCTKNTLLPAPDGGLYDFVEFYNPGGESVDLSGWGLSDKEAKPYKFTFPQGTAVAPGQRLTIYCDSTAGAENTSIAPFGLSASGETLILTDAAGNKVTDITVDALASDTSYGRYPDGSADFFVMRCTPGSENAAPEGSDAVKLPAFSADSGFYDNSFQLTITAPDGCKIYYTTDGSDPTADSTKYTSPIEIKDMSDTPNVLSAKTDISASGAEAPSEKVDKAAVVRAVCVDSQGRTSNIVTKTYFVGKTNTDFYKNMKVVSLVTDPSNLFDYEKGIYVKGKVFDEKNGGGGQPQNPWGGFGGFGGWGMINPWEMEANYTQKGREWEREATMEMFSGGETVISQNVGIRIKGAASRSAPQKSFNVYARQDYGKPEFEFDFFDGTSTKAKNGKAIKKYESVVLRNGGNDSGYAMFRDSINQSLVSDRDFAYQATNECIVFIDGEFWGIYQITEKVDGDHIDAHYGVNNKDMILIKNGETEEGTEQDLNEWNDLIRSFAESDMSQDANYQKFEQAFDVQSYIDYFAAQIFWSNDDWPQNNFAAWKATVTDETNPYADGKWRMFLFDTESGLGLYNSESKSVRADCFTRISQTRDSNECKMFINLLKNEKFREQFTLTMMDLSNYNFAPEKTEKVIGYYKNNYQQQIISTLRRFYGTSLAGNKAEERFNSEYRTISDFYQNRSGYVKQTMKNSLRLTGNTDKITVNNDTSSGSIKLNTLLLKDESIWTGEYFTDFPVTITALPAEGKSFDHWAVNGGNVPESQLTSPEISVNVQGGVTVTAIYKDGEPTSEDKDVVYGDANCDGNTDISDAVLIMQFLANPEKYPISQKGLANADCVDVPDGVRSIDALAVQMVEAGSLTKNDLPVTAEKLNELQK